MSEHSEQVELFNWIDSQDNPLYKWIFAIPNGGVRNKATASQLVHEGVRKGVWDIFVPVSRMSYHGMFVEMKYDKNKLSEHQIEFGGFMANQGYLCVVCYSAEEAKTAIGAYLKQGD